MQQQSISLCPLHSTTTDLGCRCSFRSPVGSYDLALSPRPLLLLTVMGQLQSTEAKKSRQLAELKRMAVHTGYINKQSRWLREWKRRYYMFIYNEVLGRKEILFAHDAHSLPTVTLRIGSLQANGALAELSVANHPYCICVCQAGVPMFLSANSEEERGEFVSMLRAVLPQESGTTQQERDSSAHMAKCIEDFKASQSQLSECQSQDKGPKSESESGS